MKNTFSRKYLPAIVVRKQVKTAVKVRRVIFMTCVNTVYPTEGKEFTPEIHCQQTSESDRHW
ncbi:hypothetical protein H6G41_30855 [Tolypothrix sp. FACHB-123]|uniref:hypothetical protein n=1 Tax=Tolypothrix sp. FACHB-123 TaxID=2692868 RepID=UPI001682F4A4|nr:hypothetical protein [Tolypothrix sp. FACHB-123]MBD2358947.1 hypothetical protein [Tolypothrix sp. FACHB-123]